MNSNTTEQSRIDKLLDDLALKFLANYNEEELQTTKPDSSVPYVWCDVPVDGVVPDAILNDNEALLRLVDRIHELLSSLHSTMNKWAIGCFDFADGHTYFVLLHEDACISDLCNFIQSAEEEGRATMDHLIQWMEVQETIDKTQPTFPQLYEGMNALEIEGMPKRTWRSHFLHYEEGSAKRPPHFVKQLSQSDKNKLYEALLALPPPPNPPPPKPTTFFKWEYLDKGMADYEDFAEEFSRCIEMCYLHFLQNSSITPLVRATQSIVDDKVGAFKVDFVNMVWEGGDRKYKIRRSPTRAAWSDM